MEPLTIVAILVANVAIGFVGRQILGPSPCPHCGQRHRPGAFLPRKAIRDAGSFIGRRPPQRRGD